ncbi:translation initiation factor IF-5A [Candidatus Bathyarchaeota archaeon]|nr:MAG: translation initiation factor IF-5A [Candidatus Bathyarchaeota archaeon]
MSYRITRVGELKVGNYVIIDGEPCEIVSIQKSKPGKHGSAKFRCVAISLFDGSKRNFVSPVDANIQVPIVDKRNAQVLSITPDTVQLMDLETYEVFEVMMPREEEIRSKLREGVEVSYWKIMNRNKIMRVKGA